ncbi:hypothetical protein ANANG_G00139540 [Anguilla anguilla]|uniref:Clathrin light chain n=1 Tax=Anguilla anguilla TaxID=7936 RepID=A0A9D3MDG8_ANGAN|nr:hypothetical protein ANANG_G00139540 [Anguilla anguilla]
MDDFSAMNASEPASANGVGTEEDPAAAFLAQQESEIAGIENDEGFSILDSGEVQSALGNNITDAVDGAVNGELQEESNGPSDASLRSWVSLRKWREEQQERLEVLDASSLTQEEQWKEKAKEELQEWYTRQEEQLEKTKVNNRVLDEDFYKQPFSELIGYVTHINHPCYRLDQAAEEAMVSEMDEGNPGTEWERVAHLCDFNPKTGKQAKDVSRMRSVLISLKQSPLVH